MHSTIKPLKFNTAHLDNITAQGVAELEKDFPIKVDAAGIPVVFKKTASSVIAVSFKNGLCEIEADCSPHFYFALSELVLKSQMLDEKQLYSNYKTQKCLEFRLQHFFTKNGLMLDLSRNAAAHVPMLKRLIRQTAFMGHTWFMLYMEDMYEVENEPYFGALRGRYSITDLQEIDRYAHLFGIQAVPCIQTLAHINQFFMWDVAAHAYKDIDDVLNVGSIKVKQLLERMIASLRKAFSTDTIHIGMDEAYNLGRGRYLDEQGLKSKPHIMLEHLDFMKKLCKKYDFKPIIWDDMFFMHYSNIENDPDFSIPDDVGLMYWDYYSCSCEHYTERIKQRRAIAAQTMFAGGAWRWTGYIPHHKKTLTSSIAALTACRQENIKEVIVTSWGDDGSEAPLYTCMFGAVLYAYLDRHAEYVQKEFSQYLRLYTGIGFDEWMRQGESDLFEGCTEQNYDITPSKYLLYQDPLGSKFLYYIKTLSTDMNAVYLKLEKAFTEDAAHTACPLQKHIAEFYALMMRTLYYKWHLPLDIWEAYKQGDKQALKALIETKIQPLHKVLTDTAKARRRIWHDECNAFGSEVLDHRFGAMLMRLEVTQEVIGDYVQGTIDKIDELEEERLDPCPELDKTLEPQAVHYNRALRIMSACRETW
jgi:Glycosyl hydrolase family 20, catalytic domain.